MLKSMTTFATAAVFAVLTMGAQANQKTGGDDAYFVDTRPPISSNIEVVWQDSKSKGGDAYNGPKLSNKTGNGYFIFGKYRGGDANHFVIKKS